MKPYPDIYHSGPVEPRRTLHPSCDLSDLLGPGWNSPLQVGRASVPVRRSPDARQTMPSTGQGHDLELYEAMFLQNSFDELRFFPDRWAAMHACARVLSMKGRRADRNREV